MVKASAVALTSGANRGESPAYRSSTSTAVTTFVLTPHIRLTLTQSCFCIGLPYLWSNHRTYREDVKPELSTAKSTSTAFNGLALSAINARRIGVSAGFSRYVNTLL